MPDYGRELAFGTFSPRSTGGQQKWPPKRGSTTVNKQCLSTTRQLVTS